ncbi:glycerol-3-phosphate 1-O-acyltransferase PlsY [Catenovulum sp. SM1970]|uniref:glycerol-3-phosphate 1-O-acyltransferase PlsY n=1 Tax=Marinifaba aquimaris TaxID=2741323 RepID=UPI001573A639|nr:glycerol-3-phosphate 1-O-acyltransferase PlsY [Marinifaba aquimaris]NTS78153.1 glycerol-3-phosphate 1-O-acyltransferase PlsY [Marinifaba aquimaris]
MTLMFWLMLIAAYLVGSVSGARLACVIFKTPNPLTTGSCNPGATNMYRIAGFRAAAFTFVLDSFKALIPVYGSYFLGLAPIELAIIAITACLGHIWPVFYGFKGGKGVATAFGAMLPLGLKFAAVLALTWLLVIWKSRYSSLASIVTAACAPLYVYFYKPLYTTPVLLLSLLIIVRHMPNIKRLLNGTEPTMADKDKRLKASQKAEQPSE